MTNNSTHEEPDTNSCGHIWPDEIEPDSLCIVCNLPYSEWSEPGQ